ncbi:MAG: universal stress protein [Nitrospirae bacterium]|nr:MAG: universal stress protein [Nitrospirota bacterium]
MGRYRKILVAVDGSDSSKNAFRQACRIARQDSSWITVITTIPFYQDLFQMPSIREKVSKTLREDGEKVLSEIKKIADQEDAFIRPVLEEGSPVSAIADTAEENNFDLIVMGRHGKSRLERALVGSVTARVIGHCQRDVLVIPKDASVGWSKILISTDGSKYSKAATEKAIDLAQSYGGQMEAVSVVDVTEEFHTEAPGAVEELVRKAKGFVDDIRKKAEAEGIKTETFVREGETSRVITDLSKEFKSDVIVMGSHGRTGMNRLLMGSVTEKVIGYAPCPVLIVKV